MRAFFLFVLAIISFTSPQSVNAQCVNCITYDSCIAAGANGWRSCKFGAGYCVNSGYCNGALRDSSQRFASTPSESLRSNLKHAFMASSGTQGISEDCSPSIAWVGQSAFLMTATTSDLNKLTLAADTGTLIQLAHAAPVAAQVALAFTEGTWGLMERGSIVLRSLTPRQVMSLVASEGIQGAATDSRSPVFFESTIAPGGNVLVRLTASGMPEMTLEYRRIDDSALRYKLLTWR
jgi:hypothetical protein